jgi:hypothetical protein
MRGDGRSKWMQHKLRGQLMLDKAGTIIGMHLIIITQIEAYGRKYLKCLSYTE